MLAPQKNRAGQRTYRKRDVEMALRIKELLYDDQYTIAGAKKKLTSELRGASKLKVVTPEMTGPERLASAPAQTLVQSESLPPLLSHEVEASVAPQSQSSGARASLTDGQRAAVRQLAVQLRDLLATLDASEAELEGNPRK
jgi:hypothetical protein